MLAVANGNKDKARISNATFLKGTIEEIPLPDSSVDVIISNCVINLAEDKRAVLAEALRVLVPGGRLAVSDMVEISPLPQPVKSALDTWAGCIAGTIPVDEYRQLLTDVGFQNVDIEVSREYAPAPFGGKIASGAVRATKPGPGGIHDEPVRPPGLIPRCSGSDLRAAEKRRIPADDPLLPSGERTKPSGIH